MRKFLRIILSLGCIGLENRQAIAAFLSSQGDRTTFDQHCNMDRDILRMLTYESYNRFVYKGDAPLVSNCGLLHIAIRFHAEKWFPRDRKFRVTELEITISPYGDGYPTGETFNNVVMMLADPTSIHPCATK